MEAERVRIRGLSSRPAPDELQVNIGRVAEGAGEIGSQGVEAAGDVVKGLGNAVQGLFGGRKDN